MGTLQPFLGDLVSKLPLRLLDTMSSPRLTSCATLLAGSDMLGVNATGPSEGSMDIDALIKVPNLIWGNEKLACN